MNEDYRIDWDLVADVNPYTHADFTLANGAVKISGGNIKPSSSSVYEKLCYTGEVMDWTRTSITVRVILGDGPTAYNDEGGPGLIIPSGSDQGKGYWVRHYGNDLVLYRADTQTGRGSWLANFGNINTVTGSSAATGGALDLELSDIGGSEKLKAYYNGTQIGSSHSVSTYVAGEELVPALVAFFGNSNARGWTGFAAEGLDLGGFTISDVNTDDVIDHDSAFTINGDFASVTITSVKIKQAGASDKTVSFTESDTALSCTAIDFHTASEIFPGAATVSVTDGTDTHTIDVEIVFTGDYLEIVATAINAKGVFKDITGAAVGDVAHIPPLLAGSSVSVNAAGVLAVIDPAVPNETTATWWHGDVSSHTWTAINATINQEYLAGPTWDAMPSWNVTAGRTDTLDISGYATTSGGTVGGFAISPAVPGFTIAASTGIVTYDGTPEPGQYWLTIQATDDNGTTAAPQLSVVVAADPLTLSNPRVTSITQSTATITVDALTPAGDIYIAVRDSGPYTDAANIKAGTGAAFAQNRPGALAVQFYPSGLTANQLYYYSLVQADGANDSNIISGTFTTQADIVFTETGKAPSARPY